MLAAAFFGAHGSGVFAFLLNTASDVAVREMTHSVRAGRTFTTRNLGAHRGRGAKR